MKKTTFFTVRSEGPVYPIPRGDDLLSWELYERSSLFACGHRSGAWSSDALRRMAARSGVDLVSAYWMHYCHRHGYSGAQKNFIS